MGVSAQRELSGEDATIFAACADVCARFGATLGIVFGSVARGTATRRSDVDLLVVEETAVGFFQRSDRYLTALRERFPSRAFEILVYTPAELAAMRGRPFIERALSEGVVVLGEVPR